MCVCFGIRCCQNIRAVFSFYLVYFMYLLRFVAGVKLTTLVRDMMSRFATCQWVSKQKANNGWINSSWPGVAYMRPEKQLLRSGFCSHSATAYVWTYVMICVVANFPPASAPRMCERTFSLSLSGKHGVLRKQSLQRYCYNDNPPSQHTVRTRTHA